MDAFEHQREFQTHLLTQSGCGVQPDFESMFEFELQPFVDQRGDKMGVWERYLITRFLQTNNYMDSPHLATTIQHALQKAINRVLDNNIPDDDRLLFPLASNRPSNNYAGWRLRTGEWRRGGQRIHEILQHWPRF